MTASVGKAGIQTKILEISILPFERSQKLAPTQAIKQGGIAHDISFS